MRLLIDINVFLDVVFERQGQVASSAVIASCGKNHEGWVAWHSLATLYYLIARELSATEARKFVADLLAWSQVASTNQQHALLAVALSMKDFEDALQAAAVACEASFIITRNGADFVHSPIPALSPEEFLARSS